MYFILHKDFRIFWLVFAYLDGLYHSISRNLRNHSHNQALFWNGNINGKINACSKFHNLFFSIFSKEHHLFDLISISKLQLSFLCMHYQTWCQMDCVKHLETINEQKKKFDKERWAFISYNFALKYVLDWWTQ